MVEKYGEKEKNSSGLWLLYEIDGTSQYYP